MVSFQAQVRWRSAPKPINVCCSANDNDDMFVPRFSQWYARRDVPMLKSALQKSIRRGLTPEAVQIAWQLLNIDPDALLRRLGVIMVEDVVLCSEFSNVAWLVSAISKGYQLTHKNVMWLLGLVQCICDDTEIEPTQAPVQFTHSTDTEIVKDLMTQERLVLLSVMFRASYGGMPCDGEMFRHCVLQRMHEDHEIKSYSIIPQHDIPQELQRSKIPLVSADFHCFPQILGEIHNSFPSYTPDEIRSCIWECSSKINYRQDRKDNLQAMWDTIQTRVLELQRKYLT
jgi:hypothetical protein